MKTILALSLGALMMAGGAAAYAEGAPESTGVASTPYTAQQTGSEQMPVFNYTAPAGEPADPVTISTPQLAGGSQMEPTFNYHFAVPMTRTVHASNAFPADTQISVTANGGR